MNIQAEYDITFLATEILPKLLCLLLFWTLKYKSDMSCDLFTCTPYFIKIQHKSKSAEIKTLPQGIYQKKLYLKFPFFSGFLFHNLNWFLYVFILIFSKKHGNPLPHICVNTTALRGKFSLIQVLQFPREIPSLCVTALRGKASHMQVLTDVRGSYLGSWEPMKPTNLTQEGEIFSCPTLNEKNLSRDRVYIGIPGEGVSLGGD